MSTVPTVSVCMPVYNADRYVREAAESILHQTFTDFEFIIIDDGSTDDSRNILEELAGRDSRIRLVSRPNTGYTKALKEALGLARGDYLARMDADDVSMPQRFEKQVAYLREHPECVLVGSRILTIDPYGSPLYEPNHKLAHEEIESQLLAGVGWAVVHPAVMMVREQVMALGGYRAEMEPSEDLDLFLRLAEGGRLANLPDVLLHYRQHIKSVNHTRFDEQNRRTYQIVVEAYARRGVSLPADWKLPERGIMPMKKEIDMWAWLALKHGNLHAARAHAVSLLRLAAFFSEFLASDVLRDQRILMDPVVSVLMPVYNGQTTLIEAVSSILNQTFTDFELILVDDGSTDSSLAILKSLSEKDSRIRIITRPNTGIAGALNDAITAARGEFFARMDADDISLPRRFEKQIAYLRAHPHCVLVGSRVLLVEPYGSPMYETKHHTDGKQIIDELLKGNGWAVVHPTAMMRAAAVRAAGGYRAERVPIEDLDLFLRLAETGEVANLPEVLLHYRQHLGSTNHRRFAEQEQKKRAVVTEAYAHRGATLPDGWSPPPRQQLTVEQELSQWAWIALKHRNIAAARKHAREVLRRSPLALSTWRLLYCTLRGR